MRLTFKQLNQMLDRGIVGVVKNDKPHFSFGFRGGSYLGCPGKDIYFTLPFLTAEEKEYVVNKLASLYPVKPPSNHVKWAACIRYVYGCFEKQGCLRSKSDKKRMIKEDADWSLPMNFMDSVASRFSEIGNKYGLVLHYEMLAHRLGDRAVIEKNKDLLVPMLEYYEKSRSIALSIKCWKQAFTPHYWAGGYFQSMGQKEAATNCYKKCLKYMAKYCPDAREGYREKAKVSLRTIKANYDKDRWSRFYKWYKKQKNMCLRKVRI